MQKCLLCDRTDKTHHISSEGICNACEAGILYWRRKTATAMVRRVRQLESFQNRMELLLGNVKSANKKRKRA